jgi:hypothetical protein
MGHVVKFGRDPDLRLDLGSYRGGRDLRFARTQREAGLEFFAWEGRITPRLSWAGIVLRGAAALVVVVLLVHALRAIDLLGGIH